MKSSVRFSLFALLVSVIVAVAAPAAAQAAFGIEKFYAANCNAGHPNCISGSGTPAEEKAKAEVEGFTPAGGHPPFGVTDFTVNNEGGVPSGIATEGPVTHIRTDVAPGVSTNPNIVHQCSVAEFGTEVAKGAFLAPGADCATSVIGTNKVKIWPGAGPDIELTGTVYNLVPEAGQSSLFGVALDLTPVGHGGLFAHTLIKGHVEWATDYHDYFEIEVSPELPLVSSRLSFTGNIGKGTAPFGSGGFLTNPTSCTGAGPQTTSTITLESAAGVKQIKPYETPIGNSDCDKVPFGGAVGPTFGLTPETTHSDAPDGITTTLAETHDLSEEGTDSSQVKSATITLPEGLTLNPSAAHEVTEACKPSQIGIGSLSPVTCPAGSKIGTATLNVPGLPTNEEAPDDALHGTLYLGGPESGPIKEPPYVMYIDAESARYGLSVRLKGLVKPDLQTGRLTVVFGDTPGQPPEQPFSNLVLHVNGGQNAALANPLACGTASTQASFDGYSGASFSPVVDPFTVDNSVNGGACPATLPFGPTQATANQTANAGGRTSFVFSLTRPEGHQYVSQVKTTLPPGLVGAIPAVTPCTDAQATANACPAASQIGTASAVSGSGVTPFTFGGGKVFLTGPYNGAPYGLSIVVPAVAGPFDLGPVTSRATLNVDPYTARVTTTATVPTIVQGVPTRLRGFTVSIDKQGFLFNPTSCGAFATESEVSSTFGATQKLSTPFQVANCNALKFKPAFKAVTSSRTSKANGASLETTLNEVPGDANVKSVKVQLPKALPSRLTTLQKACPAATFEANYHNCPSGSFVGGARANTPTLPGKLQGPAILVSHAAEAFPDLDLVMEANGVRSVLVGNTDIKKGITTTTFASTPDVPVSSITVNLPIGPHSALAANGNLCANPLVMPTTMTGQNGTVVKQNTTIKVNTCGVRIVGQKVVGRTAYVTVQTYAPGRISGKGSGLATRFRKLGKAQKKATILVPLSRAGQSRRRPFKVKLRVGFVPKAKGGKSSVSFVTVSFR
jgi:hypothetical protein